MPNTRINSRCLDNLNDHERLQDSLEWEGYTEVKMKSDGNCQFRALADQIYKTSNSHKRVRQEIVKQLKSHPKFYKGLVYEMEFSEYVKNMSNNSVWGDEVTLKAAANVYGVKIVLITSFKHSNSIVILPKSQKEPDKVIYLSYLAGIHYNSIHKNEGSSSSSGSDTASIELQGRKNKNMNKDKDNEKDKEKEKEKETNKNNKKKNENKQKKENMEKEKEEMEKEEHDKKEKEDKEEREKTEETEEKNKKKLHCQFKFSDVMSILEQEDDLFS